MRLGLFFWNALLFVFLNLAISDPALADLNFGGGIIGQTDQTFIGNTSDRLRVESAGVAVAMINRADISAQTVTSSGNSAAFDTAGMGMGDFAFQVTAISGSGAYIQFHLQSSTDNATWTTQNDTVRLTATGTTSFHGVRQAARYYRFSWDVAGSTPSITFTITSTLKPYLSPRKSARFLYADVDLTSNGNASTPFLADGCANLSLVLIRGADGGNNGTVQLFASNDATIWASVSSSIAANPGTTNTTFLQQLAWRYYEIEVTAKTSAGTRNLDLQWSCN